MLEGLSLAQQVIFIFCACVTAWVAVMYIQFRLQLAKKNRGEETEKDKVMAVVDQVMQRFSSKIEKLGDEHANLKKLHEADPDNEEINAKGEAIVADMKRIQAEFHEAVALAVKKAGFDGTVKIIKVKMNGDQLEL